MEPRRLTGAERERMERESDARKRRTSVRVGTGGLVLLFAGAIGIILSPANAILLIALMVCGIVLLMAAFLLVRTPWVGMLRPAEK